jgi:DNA-binding transcriptional ArsR family regulator
MSLDPDIARAAGMISDPTRARMLVALMDGTRRPATELARLAGVTPQTASSHLAKLVEARFLAAHAEGRHRYFSLAGRHIAKLIEGLSAVAQPAETWTSAAKAEAQGLRHARTCYDHFAGQLGVALARGLVRARVLRLQDGIFTLTTSGTAWLNAHGIELAPQGTRPEVRACTDWSERVPHVAGALGAALLDHARAHAWIAKVRNSRAVRVTDSGRRGFARWGIELAPWS